MTNSRFPNESNTEENKLHAERTESHDTKEFIGDALHGVSDAITSTHAAGIHVPSTTNRLGIAAAIGAEILHNSSDNVVERIVCGTGVAYVRETINIRLANQAAVVSGVAASAVATPVAGAVTAAAVGLGAYKIISQVTEPVAIVAENVCHAGFELGREQINKLNRNEAVEEAVCDDASAIAIQQGVNASLALAAGIAANSVGGPALAVAIGAASYDAMSKVTDPIREGVQNGCHTEFEKAREKQADAERQCQVEQEAAAEMQRQGEQAAVAERQHQAEQEMAAERQRQAEQVAAAERQRQVEQAAVAERQRQAQQAAAAQRQRQAQQAAAQRQRQAQQAAKRRKAQQAAAARRKRQIQQAKQKAKMQAAENAKRLAQQRSEARWAALSQNQAQNYARMQASFNATMANHQQRMQEYSRQQQEFRPIPISPPIAKPVDVQKEMEKHKIYAQEFMKRNEFLTKGSGGGSAYGGLGFFAGSSSQKSGNGSSSNINSGGSRELVITVHPCKNNPSSYCRKGRL